MMEQLPHDLLGESIRLMLGTGMRTQELLALEPRHIAQDGSMISIRQGGESGEGNGLRGAAQVPGQLPGYSGAAVAPALRHGHPEHGEKVHLGSGGQRSALQPLSLPEKIPGGAETNWGRAASDATLLSAHLRFPDAGFGCGSSHHSEHCGPRRPGYDTALFACSGFHPAGSGQ